MNLKTQRDKEVYDFARKETLKDEIKWLEQYRFSLSGTSIRDTIIVNRIEDNKDKLKSMKEKK